MPVSIASSVDVTAAWDRLSRPAYEVLSTPVSSRHSGGSAPPYISLGSLPTLTELHLLGSAYRGYNECSQTKITGLRNLHKLGYFHGNISDRKVRRYESQWIICDWEYAKSRE